MSKLVLATPFWNNHYQVGWK